MLTFLLHAVNWPFTKINFCHNISFDIYGRSSGHIIHTSYDIKIIINQRFCPVPQNLHVASVQTRNETNEGEE